MIAGTLQTDPRSGGIKRSSGVNVLPVVAEAWKDVRDNKNETNWILLGYDGNSKTDITLLQKGSGGIEECTANLLDADPCFGGFRLASSGRFVGFYYVSDDASAMKKGRASMHKNGVLNVLEGRDGEIQVRPNMTEADIGKIF